MTLEQLKQKLAKLPQDGARNKAKRAQIVAQIHRLTQKAGGKDEHGGKG